MWPCAVFASVLEVRDDVIFCCIVWDKIVYMFFFTKWNFPSKKELSDKINKQTKISIMYDDNV